MAKKLFVGGLSSQTTEDTLRASFGQFGTIESVKIITDRETGQSRGFAFVEMATPEGAQRVISTLSGSELDGRRMTIKEALPPEQRAPRAGE